MRRHRLFMIKISIMHGWMKFKDNCAKLLHCRWGYHHYIPRALKVTEGVLGKKKEIVILDVHWQACTNCGLQFFVTEKDKKDYLAYKEKERKRLFKMFDNVLKKRKKIRAKK